VSGKRAVPVLEDVTILASRHSQMFRQMIDQCIEGRGLRKAFDGEKKPAPEEAGSNNWLGEIQAGCGFETRKFFTCSE
jgi:hypothetical protein